jgi:hypothetical protein
MAGHNDPDLCVNTDNDSNIDISIDNLKRTYPVSVVYKPKQKSNSGAALPFKAIDKAIYKSRGNCVCFITSEKRIHAWMRSIAQRLYFELGSINRYNVIRRDHKEKSSIIHRECIVSDSSIDTESTGDHCVPYYREGIDSG